MPQRVRSRAVRRPASKSRTVGPRRARILLDEARQEGPEVTAQPAEGPELPDDSWDPTERRAMLKRLLAERC